MGSRRTAAQGIRPVHVIPLALAGSRDTAGTRRAPSSRPTTDATSCRETCAPASAGRSAARTTDRGGTRPACGAPSSSARPSSAGTRSLRPPGARCASPRWCRRTPRRVDSRPGRARRSRASSACPGYGVGCWMYGQSTCLRANVEIRGNRLARVVGVADDQPADDEHAVTVQDVDRFDGRVAGRVRPRACGCSSRAP